MLDNAFSKSLMFLSWVGGTTLAYSFIIHQRGYSIPLSVVKAFWYFYFLNVSFPVILLGVFGKLNARWFIPLSLIVSMIFVSLSLYLRKKKGESFSFTSENLLERTKSKLIGSRTQIFLYVPLSFFALFYVLIVLRASYLFPVRGIDDISYHLPQIVENMVDEKLVQLSIESDPRYAFPKMAHMLSQAYILLAGNLTFVDFINFWFALVLALSIFYISSSLFGVQTLSFLSFLSPFFTPVVLGQMGANYVDLAFASFFISSIAFLISGNFFLSGLCFGGFLGTKYIAFLLVPFFLLWVLRRGKLKKFLIFSIGSFLGGSFFYIFLFWKTGYIVYPLPWTEEGKRIYPPSLGLSPEHIVEWIRIALAFVKYDNLELSFHKGFGLHFWLLSLPLSFIFVVRKRVWKKPEFLLFSVALAYLVWKTVPTIHVNARFLIWFACGTFIFIPYVHQFAGKIKKFLLLFAFFVFFLNAFFIYPKMKKTEWPILFNEKSNSCPNTTSNLLDSGKALWYPNFEEPASFLEFLGEKYYAEKGKKIKVGTCNAIFYGDKITNLLMCPKDDGKNTDDADFKLSFDVWVGKRHVSKLVHEVEGYRKIFSGDDFAVFVREDFFIENEDFLRKVLDEYKNCRWGKREQKESSRETTRK